MKVFVKEFSDGKRTIERTIFCCKKLEEEITVWGPLAIVLDGEIPILGLFVTEFCGQFDYCPFCGEKVMFKIRKTSTKWDNQNE
jgi:hypothetical protein